MLFVSVYYFILFKGRTASVNKKRKILLHSLKFTVLKYRILNGVFSPSGHRRREDVISIWKHVLNKGHCPGNGDKNE